MENNEVTVYNTSIELQQKYLEASLDIQLRWNELQLLSII